MSDNISYKNELNVIVKEYLADCGFNKTLTVFNDECSDKGCPIQNDTFKSSNSSRTGTILKQLMTCFSDGNFKEFFKLWNENIAARVKNETEFLRLEVFLRVYFALYPIKHNMKGCNDAMEDLGNYLRINGQMLSQSQEFLSFFALPYISNLKEHAAYQDLLSDKWAQRLEIRLQGYFKTALQSENNPRLYELYKASQDQDSVGAVSSKRFNCLVKNYNTIIQITADLIELLEGAAQGMPITQAQVEQVTKKLFSDEVRTSTDLSRPGTAAQTLRQSVVLSSTKMPDVTKKNEKGLVDYQRVKSDLMNRDNKKKIILLQALRLKLTKSAQLERNKILNEYIQHDLLGCLNSQNILLGMVLKSDDNNLKQSFVKLMNAIASLYEGRSYLSQDENAIEIFIETIQSHDLDEVTQDHWLGCLQKLSLREKMQMLMIKKEMVAWVVKELKDFRKHSLCFIEYGIFLLTNLCFRSAGRDKCSLIAGEVLDVLMSILKSEDSSPDTVSCITGMLYSILAKENIKEMAQNMGLSRVLKDVQNSSDETLKKHIEFVIQRLASPGDDGEESSKEDDNDDEDNNTMEDLDQDEILPNVNEMLADYSLASYRSNDKETASTTGYSTFSSGHQTNASQHQQQPNGRPPTRVGGRSSKANISESLEPNRRLKENEEKVENIFKSQPKIPRSSDSNRGFSRNGTHHNGGRDTPSHF